MLLPPRHFYPSRSQFYTLRVVFRLVHFKAKPKLPSQWKRKNFDLILLTKHWLLNRSPNDKNEISQGTDSQSNKRKFACCNKCFNRILPLIVLLKASVTYEPPCFINCDCNVNTCIRIFLKSEPCHFLTSNGGGGVMQIDWPGQWYSTRRADSG